MNEARRGVGLASGVEEGLGDGLADEQVAPAAAGGRGEAVGELDEDGPERGARSRERGVGGGCAVKRVGDNALHRA